MFPKYYLMNVNINFTDRITNNASVKQKQHKYRTKAMQVSNKSNTSVEQNQCEHRTKQVQTPNKTSADTRQNQYQN